MSKITDIIIPEPYNSWMELLNDIFTLLGPYVIPAFCLFFLISWSLILWDWNISRKEKEIGKNEG